MKAILCSMLFKRQIYSVLIVFLGWACVSFSPEKGVQIARLKYAGGGDWYANKSALPNLIAFCNRELGTSLRKEEAVVEPGSPELFNYPFVHMTGHGTFTFSDREAENMRNYLIGGGFLHIDDNYGLDPFVRPQMKKVFPELDFVELPFSHPIYHQRFEFPGGLPKIHEHDNKVPQGFALIHKGRVVCYYTYECDLGNGWEDLGTYPGDGPELHQKALEMGANMLMYIFGSDF